MTDDSQSKTIDPAHLALVASAIETYKADAKTNGWTARARREVDQHRREAGKDEYNDARRAAYATQKLEETGKLPRAYRKKPTSEQRPDEVGVAVKKHRSSRSPAKVEADRKRAAEREKERRASLKGKMPWADKAIF